MESLPFDLFDFMGPMLAVTLIVPLVTVVLVVGVIVWAIRRSAPASEDPAVAELKSRLARGEISPVEYEVRMRALQDAEE
jgi:uncharacterized membrane protein